MRVVCIYREGEDYSRTVSDWLEDFYRRTGHELETMNPDIDSHFCEAYDVTQYPTLMALGPDGEAMNVWRGLPLPLFNEILYYVNA